MSVNFGTDNAGRYFSCPDHADLTLTGDHTWLVVMAPYTTDSTYPKYFLSTGEYEAANSMNLLVTSAANTIGYPMNGTMVQTSVAIGNHQNILAYGRRISSTVGCGEIRLDTQAHNKSPTRTDSTASDGGTLYVGARTALLANRYAQGYVSWVALLNVGLSDSQLASLAAGTTYLVDDFSANIVELWDMSVNAATITGTNGHVLTRTGTGFGADGSDPLPHTSTPVPIAFSGTIANQEGNVGSVFSLDVSSFFTGNQTPFSYSVQVGTLPAGLTLSGSVISGTPTTVETQSGIVLRGTDAALNTADSNAFSINIAAAVAATKGIRITLNSRASLQPVPSVTSITARFWDSPTATGAPLLENSTESLDVSGVLEIDVNSVTSLPVGGYGYLVLYKAGATPEQDLHFAGRVPIVDLGA